ncbi:hypothetical protein QWJ34_02670 [Saccharibacillus sp. CPCC 101409]|uniref:hypothetical protein n=1 Tax=Saccharibacillus sp. CPCC 101409 TaxID=3058041 RepID=UPI002673FCFC|nr:hypothetical protein [Saccharibacillus sp. CPCC 101409]MDO3408662.1 hypothetical protein [Saccharibacillus sp. CPCC 101409]
MATNRKLETERDFQEAMDNERTVRVFQNDDMINPGGLIIRFDDSMIAVQSSVSDLDYYDRRTCEFYELRR